MPAVTSCDVTDRRSNGSQRLTLLREDGFRNGVALYVLRFRRNLTECDHDESPVLGDVERRVVRGMTMVDACLCSVNERKGGQIRGVDRSIRVISIRGAKNLSYGTEDRNARKYQGFSALEGRGGGDVRGAAGCAGASGVRRSWRRGACWGATFEIFSPSFFLLSVLLCL